MTKKLSCKYFLAFGFLLLILLLLPVTPAKAASIDIEKNDSYHLNLKSLTLVKDKTKSLNVYNLSKNSKLSFKSDDAEIASVSDDGTVTANKVGTTTIRATIKDGATTTDLDCVVTVGLPAFSVKLTRSRIILGLEKTDFLSAILKPSNTVEDAKFSSNDISIATVSTGGRVTAKKVVGLTYVFAAIDALNVDQTPRFSRCTVIVTPPEEDVLLEAYFNDHPELSYITEDDLNKAIVDFIGTKYDPTSTFVSGLSSYLEDKFKLEDLRAQRKADLAKLTN